ncbi:MAG: sulfotransferase [Dongiaceae bacterium]
MPVMPAAIRTRFFVFGLPKSGTTWLQMLLDAHPEISCPSEHQLSHFLDALPKLITDYNIVLNEIDRRTANQGATLFGNDDLLAITRAIADRCIESGARRKQAAIAGIKDNTLVGHLDLFQQLYPEAHFLCIVRDPRDTALSSWHHNNRVEAGFRKRAPDFPNWAAQTWTRWCDLYRTAIERAAIERAVIERAVIERAGAAATISTFSILRYEDLIGPDRETTLAAVLAQLGAARNPATIDGLFAATELGRLRQGAAAPFFRVGRAGGWREAAESANLPPMPAEMQALLAHFGYPPAA